VVGCKFEIIPEDGPRPGSSLGVLTISIIASILCSLVPWNQGDLQKYTRVRVLYSAAARLTSVGV